MRYRVVRSPEADEEIGRLSPEPRKLANRAINRLRNGPYFAGSDPLEGFHFLWRVRLSRHWRLVFEFYAEERLIRVTRVRRRTFAYLGLERPDPPR